jgi:hypothetical protein
MNWPCKHGVTRLDDGRVITRWEWHPFGAITLTYNPAQPAGEDEDETALPEGWLLDWDTGSQYYHDRTEAESEAARRVAAAVKRYSDKGRQA